MTPILNRSCPLHAMLLIVALCLCLPADAGVTEPQSAPLEGLPFVFGIAVDRTDPTNLLLATRRGLFRAGRNGTATQISQSREIFWNILVDPATPTRLFATSITESGETDGLFVSTNSGQRFTRLFPTDGVRRYFRVIVIDKAGSGAFYGLSNDIWQSMDGGVSWNRMGTPPIGTIDIAVSSLDTRKLYAATRSGVLMSRDSGRTWNDLDDALCLQPVIAIDAGADGVIYAFSLCMGLVRINEETGKTTVVASPWWLHFAAPRRQSAGQQQNLCSGALSKIAEQRKRRT